LATLKPHLTVLAPSLSTGCLPGFAGQGVAPCYIISAELAHNRPNVVKLRKTGINPVSDVEVVFTYEGRTFFHACQPFL
jgi:hypothetical protein